jgi:hypothetical protein
MNSRIIPILILCGLMIQLTLGAGCLSPSLPGVETTREFQGTYNVSRTTSIEVRNLNGEVEINTGDQEMAEVNATLGTLYGSSELDRVQILVTTDDILRVETVHPTPPARVTVNYLITIPRSLPVTAIESSNGGITVTDAQGDARLSTSNGPIGVISFAGDLTAHTSNGAIMLENITGVVSASTSNAEIILQNVSALTLAETSNGRISADIISVERDITISTSNARVLIQIAPGLNADLLISTSNGQILLTNVPITVQRSTRTELNGTIGEGGHQIAITTSNADVEIRMLSP